MSILVDAGAYHWRRMVQLAGDDVGYQGFGLTVWTTIKAYMRNPTTEELAAQALQQDIIAIVDAAEFARLFPGRPRPLQFDRVQTAGPIGMRYTVEVWKPRPAQGGTPVVFALTLRGGGQ